MKKIWNKQIQTKRTFTEKEIKKTAIKFLLKKTHLLSIGNFEDTYLIRKYLNDLLNESKKTSSLSRITKICPFTGRARGFYTFPKMSRFEFRKWAGAGWLTGIRKGSW